ncbi:MAG: KxYKxGKxW signal peptide domain-containing protein, partial [Lactobacillaceae bacterium]|nr:KxYKxGKxW signal peptide domain-containing protein [Lactobacillaceae bacterium]
MQIKKNTTQQPVLKSHKKMFKAGKLWMVAGLTTLSFAGGVTASTVLSSNVASAQLLTGANETGADNTATAGLGSDTTAGVDNAKTANTNKETLKNDQGVNETEVITNTNGSYADVTGQTGQSYSEPFNSGASTLVNASGAIQAGSGASSAVSFDIKQTVSNAPVQVGDGGNNQWTVTAPADLTNAGLKVADVNVIYDASRMANQVIDPLTGETVAGGSILADKLIANVQTVGGNRGNIDTNVINYYPDSATASANFKASSLAASIAQSAADAAASYTASYVAFSEAAAALQKQYDELNATLSPRDAANSQELKDLAKQVTSNLNSAAANSLAAAELVTSINASNGYVVTPVASSAFVVANYTTDSGATEALNKAFTQVWGEVVAGPIPAIGQGISSVITGTADTIGQALTGDILLGDGSGTNGLLSSIITGVGQTIETLGSGVPYIKDITSSITDYINSNAVNAVKSVYNALGIDSISLSSVITGGTAILNNVLTSVFNALTNGIYSVVDATIGNLPIVGTAAAQVAANWIGDHIAPIFTDNVNAITSSVTTVANALNGLIGTFSNGLKEYAANVDASSQHMLNMVNDVKELVGTDANGNGTFSESYLANVTDNGDGTFTITDDGTHSPINALANKVSLVVNGYTDGIAQGMRSIVTLPASLVNIANGFVQLGDNIKNGDLLGNASDTVKSILGTLVTTFGNVVNGTLQTVNNATSLAANSANTIISKLSNFTSDFVGNLTSFVGTLSFGGTTSVTVGFTAQDPTDEIKEGLTKAGNYYEGQAALLTPKAQDGTFVPETFKIAYQTNSAIGGSAIENNTTVVYQYNASPTDDSALVKYVDDKGNAIDSALLPENAPLSVTGSFIEGDTEASKIKVPAAPVIEGYIFVEVDPKSSTNFTSGDDVITFVYKKDQAAATSEASSAASVASSAASVASSDASVASSAASVASSAASVASSAA